MRRLLLVLFALGVSACRCGGGNVSGRFGELVIVQDGATGRELLLREATITLAPAFMETLSAGEVPVRNVGLEEISIVSVTRLEGDPSLTLDDAVGMSVAAGDDAVLPVRFAPGQAPDATTPEVTHRAKFSVQLSGARAGEEELVVELVALAVARDCYVPARLDFGRVPLQQAIVAPLVLANGRALPATTTIGAVSGADAYAFFLDVPGGALEVAAGGRVELPVRFSPLEERAYAASLPMRRAEGCPDGLVHLTGEGSNEALTWSPARLDFGRLPLGVSVTKQVTVVNNSNVALSLQALLPAGSYSVGAGAPSSLPPRASVRIDVSCKPVALGPLPELLTLELGTLPVTPARIPLTCTGGGPRVRVDPNPLQFGLVPINGTTRRRLIVQNVGTAPPAPGDPSNNLRLGTGGALPWFAIVPKNASTTAAEFNVGLRGTYDAAAGIPAVVGSNFVEFEVTITPTSVGGREADLLVYSNDAKEPVARIALTATPRLPETCTLSVTPAGADFGPAPRGAVISRTILFTNDSPVEGSTCLISGLEMAPGSNLAFQVGDPGLPSLLVQRGQSRAVRVDAAVPGDANIGDYLRGTLRFQVSGETNPRALPVDLQVSRCLVLDPPVLDLGVVQTGCTSASKAVTLYNVCGSPIGLTGTSTPNAPFRITSSPLGLGTVTLDPSQHVTVLIAAAPSGPGTFADTLRFDSLEGGETWSQSVALRATANASGLQGDTFTQGTADVDILLVVDNSCSMGDEQAALATNFASFISSATQGTGNWHIGVITTDVLAGRGVLVQSTANPRYLTPTTPNVAALFAQKVQLGTLGSGQEQPYQSLSLAVTSPNRTGANGGFIRPDAALAVVIVTDALEQSPNSAGSYLATLRQLKNNRPDLLSVNVVGPFSPPGPMCSTEGSVDDGRFGALIDATGGVRADICTQDWATDLETVSRSVFGSRRSFELAGTPRTSNDVTVTVDGVVVTTWRLDTVHNAIVFTGAPSPGAAISIDYRTACF